MPGSENKHINGNGTRRGFDCSSLPVPVDRHSRVFSKTNTRWCARLAVGRGKFNLTGAMREHGRTNKESGARKETVFYARSFSCPNNYKEGCVGGYARAPLDVYKVWSKSSGEIFSWNCLFEGICELENIHEAFFSNFEILFLSIIDIIHLSFQLASFYSYSFSLIVACLWHKLYKLFPREIKIWRGKSQIEMINSMSR